MSRPPTSQSDNNNDLGAYAAGITALDIADLPDPLRSLMNMVLRLASADGVSAQALQSALPEVEDVPGCLGLLAERGFLRVTPSDDGGTYHANLRRKPGAKKGINWDKLLGDD